jgi:hypothetical protein
VTEQHVFIVWSAAADRREAILADLESRFRILGVWQVEWSQARFSENMTRFYGENLPPGSFKEEHCGRGPFTLAIVEDAAPAYELRQTSKGWRSVNRNTFDAKARYRGWTGGGHKIHATDSAWEANHNVTLLFGRHMADLITERDLGRGWEGEIREHRADLAGAEGWASIEDLLYVLNGTVNYVILRNFERFPEAITLEGHDDVDLLVERFGDARHIIGGEKVFGEDYRVHFRTVIGGQVVAFDIRSVGDGYYDEHWQRNILATRVLDPRGFYVPDDENYFYSLLYHALFQKPKLKEDYRTRLAWLGQKIGVAFSGIDVAFGDYRLSDLLWGYLGKRAYTATVPVDRSVHFKPVRL